MYGNMYMYERPTLRARFRGVRWEVVSLSKKYSNTSRLA